MYMRRAVALLMALSFSAASAGSPQLSDADFRQLMQSAVTVSGQASQVQPTTTTICVQRELEPALDFLKHQGPSHLPIGIAAADQALNEAMSPMATVARQTSMPLLPARFILIPKANRPRNCVVDRIPLPGQPPSKDSVVVLSFTRPAFAEGYAFIEENEDCPGLCGTIFLR